MDWLYILGSIASIVGALWALYEAQQSRGYANQAKEARDEVVQRRGMIEVSQIHAETSRILRRLSVVGPSCSTKSIRGVDCAGVAGEVEEYARALNEQSSHFSDMFDNQARALCADLRDDIEALSEAKDFDSKKGAGKSIYYKIYAFMPLVKALADERRER